MNISDIALQRMQTQRLIGPSFARPEEMVRWHGAVQSQDFSGAKWSIAQRSRDTTDTDLDRLFNSGEILRTHAMRPTWHFVMPEDIRWIQELTAHRVHALSKSRYRELEIDEHVAGQARELFARALEGGTHLTRVELGEALQRGGIEADGQRLGYLAMWAELDAVICSGPRKGKQHTYALLDERVPPARAIDPEDALAELTRRYFTSHGPATPHDFSWWSGLTVKDARRGIGLLDDELTSELIDDTTWWFVPAISTPSIEPPLIHLLQPWDEYVVGFRNHQPTWNADARAMQHPKGELWNANLLAVDGGIVGGWRRKLGKNEIRITKMLPVRLDDAEHAALMRAAEDYGRFLGLPVVVETS